jgi:hypothetical protein
LTFNKKEKEMIDGGDETGETSIIEINQRRENFYILNPNPDAK